MNEILLTIIYTIQATLLLLSIVYLYISLVNIIGIILLICYKKGSVVNSITLFIYSITPIINLLVFISLWNVYIKDLLCNED